MVSALPLALSLFAAAPAAPEAMLARSLERYAAGDYPAAAAALAPDAQGRRCGAPLEPYCALYRGEALFWAGRFAEAAQELKLAREGDSDGPVAARALAREGEAWLKAGRLDEAAARLKEALAHEASAELRLSYAEVLAAQGDAAGADEEWRKVYVEFPDHPGAKIAKRRLKASGAWEKLGASAHLERAERLLGAGLGSKALASAHRAMGLARAEGERARAELDLAKALAMVRDAGQAEAILRELAASRAPPALQVEALLSLGRLAMARGDAQESGARLDELVKRFEKDSAADEAAFLSAWVRFNVGDYPGCASRFEAFVAERRAGKRGEDGLWYLGLCRRLAGDKDGADQAFLELEKASAKLAPQALYWRARDAASRKVAETLYRQVARRAPASWYAWLARKRLAELGAAPEPFPLTAQDGPTAAFSGEREQRAVLLAKVGLARDAAAELSFAARSVKGASDAERLASACTALGQWGRAYALANARLWGEAFERRSPAALALLYPRAFAGPVRESAEAVGFDPYFLWAIMRRESAFDPLALSSARAFGLMQLLAPTATKIAYLAGEPEPDLESLQRPERIVPLATWYLAELAGRFGHAGLAAAAYNGGPNSVARWVADRGSLPLDEFVELIPYKETRLYVKGVLGDYFTYRALWGASGGELPFDWKIPAPAAGASF